MSGQQTQGKWDGRRTVESQLFPQDVSVQAQKKGEEGIITSNLTSDISGQVQNLGMGFIFSCIFPVILDDRVVSNTG